MKHLVKHVVLVGTILLTSPLFGQGIEIFQGREAARSQVLVKFTPGSEGRLAEAVAAHDVDRTRRVGRDGFVLLHSRTRDVNRLIQELRQRAYVQYVEPDYVVRANATPNDPSFALLWGLRNTGQSILGVPGTPGNDIGAVAAWDISTGSSSVVVGVIDTGVDYNHQDLQANIWSAPAPFTVTIGGVPLTCPAGSHGYNAIANSCNPLDDHNHGTHVSGTIGARGNNSLGVAGVNWTTSIMGLKFLPSIGFGLTSDAIEAIEFAIQAKAIFGAAANVRVLSNSWGGRGFSQALLDQINRANGVNMLFVAAAGNETTNNDFWPFYPASYSAANIVSVASINNRDQLAFDSNYGASSVHLGAPGVDILSTIRNNAYTYLSGTSMAAPHVSGAAALVLSACGSLSTAALKQLLLANVIPTPALTSTTSTRGRLNVDQAIRACAADYSLSATPLTQTVSSGSGTSYTINIARAASFSGTVTFSVSGLPSGAGGTFSPNPTSSAASTLTVTTSAITPAGTYPLTITGVSGILSRSTSATLVVTASGAVPDLTIAKSHSGNFTQGQVAATYTILVTNAGVASTSGTVTVSDTLPAGLTATAIAGSGWSCTQPVGACTRSDLLGAGASYPAITLTVNVSASAAASVTNTATVSGGGETNTANNTASDVTTISAAGGATQSIWPASTVPSSPWRFDFPGTFGLRFRSDVAGNITGIRFYKGAGNTGTHIGLLYNNAGTLLAQATFSGETASGWQQVTFPGVAISPNTTYVAAFWSSTGYALNNYFFGSNGVDNPPLHALQSGVDGPNGASSYGSAPVFPSSGFSAANYWVDVVFSTAAAVPDLTIAKSHSGNFTRGQVGATYTINVTNAGAGSTSGTVTVSDTLPAGLTATAMAGSGWSCAQPAGPCTRGDVLGAGGSYPAITLTVNVSASAPASVTNTATVSGGGETNTGNNTASDVTSILAAAVPDLTIAKSHSGNFTRGQIGATYTILVSNSGAASTSGTVTVSDTVPAGLTATAMTGSGWSCAQPAGPCTRSDLLGAGTSYLAITLTVNVSVSAPASVTNTATVSGGGETNTGNNTANDVTSILAAAVPDLTIAKSHSGNFTQGQVGATYSIVVTNSGAASTSGTVTVSDTLPAGLTATAIAGSGWSCAQPAGSCTRNDLLGAAASYPAITLTVNVSASAAASVTNTAMVSGGGETNTGNNTASDVTTISPAGGATRSIWPASTVPSSPWRFDFPGTFGLRFRSDVAGNVTGIRFYKGAGNTGTHIGLLYDNAGTLLAQATFSGETASGWQQVTFPGVAISPNTTYVAAFFSSTGYALNNYFFGSNGVDNPPLHALQSGVDGPNGASSYGSVPTFPSSGFTAANYWVDVVFTPQ